MPHPGGEQQSGGVPAWRGTDQRWISAGGSRVRVTLIGHGPELLLLNGLGAHSRMLEPLVHRLQPTRRCVMLDMPGTGASPPLRRPRRMASLADLVAEVLDGLELSRVDVLGYSWGGALAQQFARDHHTRVRRLCLVSTVPGVGGRPPPMRVTAVMLNPTRYSSRERALQAAAVLYGGEYRQAERLGESALSRWHESPPSRRGYALQLYAIAGWTSLPWLHQIRARTLILAGDDDPLVPVQNVRLMGWLIRDASVRIARGGGHLWLLDHPEQSARLIERFLTTDSPSAVDSSL